MRQRVATFCLLHCISSSALRCIGTQLTQDDRISTNRFLGIVLGIIKLSRSLRNSDQIREFMILQIVNTGGLKDSSGVRTLYDLYSIP